MGKVEVSRVIRGQPVLAAERLNAAEYSVCGDLRQHYWKRHEVSKEGSH